MDENLTGPTGPTPRERLKIWRKGRDLSQAEAGAMVGVSGPAWCEWESGGRNPTDHRAALEVLTGIPAAAWATDREREALERAHASVANLSSVAAANATPAPADVLDPGAAA